MALNFYGRFDWPLIFLDGRRAGMSLDYLQEMQVKYSSEEQLLLQRLEQLLLGRAEKRLPINVWKKCVPARESWSITTSC